MALKKKSLQELGPTVSPPIGGHFPPRDVAIQCVRSPEGNQEKNPLGNPTGIARKLETGPGSDPTRRRRVFTFRAIRVRRRRRRRLL